MNEGPSTRWQYRGQIVDVVAETAHFPDGREAELEIVRHPGGSAVVAIDDAERVCLLRQYRHVAGGWIWELPAGKRDGLEDPAETARRELEEEAGVRARDWRSLGHTLSSPGVFTEVVHLYAARALQPGLLAHEPLEYIERHWIPLATALAWAASGEIYDAKSVIGLFRVQYTKA